MEEDDFEGFFDGELDPASPLIPPGFFDEDELEEVAPPPLLAPEDLAHLPFHGEEAVLLVDREEGALAYSLRTVRHQRWLRFHATRTIFEIRARQRRPTTPLLLIRDCEATLYSVSFIARPFAERFPRRRELGAGADDGVALCPQIVEHVVDTLRRGLAGRSVKGHQVQITLLSQHLEWPIFGDSVSLAHSSYAVESLFKMLHRVLVSKKGMPLDDSFRIHALVTDLSAPTVGALGDGGGGGGGKRKKPRMELVHPDVFRHTRFVPRPAPDLVKHIFFSLYEPPRRLPC